MGIFLGISFGSRKLSGDLFSESHTAPLRCLTQNIKVFLQPDPWSRDERFSLKSKFPGPALSLPGAVSSAVCQQCVVCYGVCVLCQTHNCVMWVIPAEADLKWPTAHCIVSGIKIGQETGLFWLQQTKWTPCEKNLKFQVEICGRREECTNNAKKQTRFSGTKYEEAFLTSGGGPKSNVVIRSG